MDRRNFLRLSGLSAAAYLANSAVLMNLEAVLSQDRQNEVSHLEQQIEDQRKYHFVIENKDSKEMRRYTFSLNELIDPQVGSSRAEDYRLQQIVVRDGAIQGNYTIISEAKDNGRYKTPAFKFNDGKGFTTGNQMVNSLTNRARYAPVEKQLKSAYLEYRTMLDNWLKSRN